jgi:hypothetical protein
MLGTASSMSRLLPRRPPAAVTLLLTYLFCIQDELYFQVRRSADATDRA